MKNCFEEVVFIFVTRSCNSLADLIAKFVRTEFVSSVWLENFPPIFPRLASKRAVANIVIILKVLAYITNCKRIC